MATSSTFQTPLQRPAQTDEDASWAFVVLPKSVSDTLPRRGRTTVSGTLNGHAFQVTLEPDGQLSHWFKVDATLREAAGVQCGDTVTVQLSATTPEPEPRPPEDLYTALAAHPEARAGWERTSTLARVDWIHWVESAKQAKTRQRRVENACDMLASGKLRVCCFDPSGYYSKSFRAPEAA